MVDIEIKNENTPILCTQRLILRKFVPDDLENIVTLYGDKAVNEFLPWFAHRSKEETEKYLKEVILPEYEKPLAYCYAIVLKEKSCIVGFISIHHIDRDAGSAELGYAIKKDFWNQGIVTEAGAEVLRRLKHNGFLNIIATHDVRNTASGTVLKKLGFKYLYSYNEQWQPKNFAVTFRLYKLNFEGGSDKVCTRCDHPHPEHFIETQV